MSSIDQYVYKYPQLTLPIQVGMSKSEEYGLIVRKGILPDKLSFPFQQTGFETADVYDTPAGKAEVLYLPDRNIFEYFVKVLAYRCEPVDIPASTGAILISGINNWRKIQQHRQEYEQNGGTDWASEFKAFTSNPSNYKDVVLLVSKGNYSNLSAELAGYDPDEWIEKSKVIRSFHEMTHFISRKLFIENKEALRDEIVADSVGIIAAFGYYDDLLAKKVLGIENPTYRQGGRLENYVDKQVLENEAIRAGKIIEELKKFYNQQESKDPFALLVKLEKDRIAIL